MNDPIDHGVRKQGGIESLLNDYLSKFKVIQSPRLFDIDDETILIRQGICPICNCNLKVSQAGNVYCNSKKHLSISKKRLFITRDGMERLSTVK